MNALDYTRHIVDRFYRRDDGGRKRFRISPSSDFVPKLECTCYKRIPKTYSYPDCLLGNFELPQMEEEEKMT